MIKMRRRWLQRQRQNIALVLICCIIVLSLNGVSTAPAQAAIRTLEEAPGQVVYQTRHSLSDQQGGRWQAIAFKRVRPNGDTTLMLRLSGFPGSVSIERSQPLRVIDSLGHEYAAADTSSQMFSDRDHPEPHIGQYDLQTIAKTLRPELPLRLRLAQINGPDLIFNLPPDWVQEWAAIANR